MLLSTNTDTQEIDFSGIDVITIYMGDNCNFDCAYCDRGYIKNTIGSQHLAKDDVDHIVDFMKVVAEKAGFIRDIGFHGGEPFLFIKRIDKILERIQPLFTEDQLFYITTNGSLIEQHEWFFKKWGKQIRITLSYDFNYQLINRAHVDLEKLSEIIRKYDSGMQFQFVIPSNIKDAFHYNTIHAVLRDMRMARCDTLNLIPLRHMRGKDKFKVLIDDIDLKWFSVDLMRFIHTMYVNGININLDGNYEKIDKHYLNNHGKIILGADGYMYPEFDFLEYKRDEYRIGQWKGDIKMYRVQEEDPLLLDKCVSCPVKTECGLKYLYKLFDEEPKGNCEEFYKIMNLMVKHLYKLKRQPTLMHWIGYEGDGDD